MGPIATSNPITTALSNNPNGRSRHGTIREPEAVSKRKALDSRMIGEPGGLLAVIRYQEEPVRQGKGQPASTRVAVAVSG